MVGAVPRLHDKTARFAGLVGEGAGTLVLERMEGRQYAVLQGPEPLARGLFALFDHLAMAPVPCAR